MAKFYIITGLDIGTSNLKVLVAKKKPDTSDFEVLAQVSEPCSGVRRGVVVNPGEVSQKISSLLSQAEKISGQKINSLFINIGGSHIFVTSSHGSVAISRADNKISQEDIERVLQAAKVFSLPSNKEIIDIFPKEFIIDGEGGIKEPLEMKGVRLEAEILAVCVFSPYLKNLTEAVLDSGFQINDLILNPLASAKAVLLPRQRELGVALIDIGAGTTDLAVFEEGDLIHTAILPIGSAHITNDIAIGLRTDIDLAERIKLEFGSCHFSGKTGKTKKQIKIETKGDSLVFSKKTLEDIIEARILEIFREVQKELKKISRAGLLPAGIVLTGGGARMPRIKELAKKELKLPCQIGIPKGFIGLEKDPRFSTVCGLVLSGIDSKKDQEFPQFSKGIIKGIISKLKKIFKIFIP
jgi:cell division protein FtsA